jgi:hypothetical protein
MQQREFVGFGVIREDVDFDCVTVLDPNIGATKARVV